MWRAYFICLGMASGDRAMVSLGASCSVWVSYEKAVQRVYCLSPMARDDLVAERSRRQAVSTRTSAFSKGIVSGAGDCGASVPHPFSEHSICQGAPYFCREDTIGWWLCR